MTHDELLEFVQKDINDAAFKRKEYYPTRSLLALKAVLQLHKQDYGMCMTCQMQDYPCPTISAIELELK